MATDKEKAEELRLQGNDAYRTQDFERALQLYGESAAMFPQANTLSNLCAVLHKTGYYQEASKAAKKATEVDPEWAKGWWRRGLASELEKDFHSALSHYGKAAELDKTNKEFRRHWQRVQKRLNMIEATKSRQPGWDVSDMPRNTMDLMDTPAIKAWRRGQATVDGAAELYSLKKRWETTKTQSGNNNSPTSQQYLFWSISSWIVGLKSAVAGLSGLLDPQIRQRGETIKEQFKSNTLTQQDIDFAEQTLGGIPTGMAMEDLVMGFTTHGGENTFTETAPGRICPQPTALRGCVSFQHLALLNQVQRWVPVMMKNLNTDLKFGPGIFDAYTTFFANVPVKPEVDISHMASDLSPEDIVKYVKESLPTKGRPYDEHVRQYVDVTFHGTLTTAIFYRDAAGAYQKAYELVKWANEFVDLMDENFKVTENASFETHGNCFRKSLRVGAMMAQLSLVSTLRRGTDDIGGPYPLPMVLDLCLEISDIANEPEHLNAGDEKALHDVFYRRKPLALVHSQLAMYLNQIRGDTNPEFFLQVAKMHELLPESTKECDAFAVIAEQYRIAAENELPDADTGSIYWWAYATNLARSEGGESQRTLGELRRAVQRAQENESLRNVELFGKNKQANGVYELIAKLVVAHFEDQDDSFVFPKVVSDTVKLTIGDEIICHDLEQHQRKEEMEIQRREKEDKLRELMDTSELEREFGLVGRKLPSLETLATRALHKDGASFARGEVDGDVIVQKAMDEVAADTVASSS